MFSGNLALGLPPARQERAVPESKRDAGVGCDRKPCSARGHSRPLWRRFIIGRRGAGNSRLAVTTKSRRFG